MLGPESVGATHEIATSYETADALLYNAAVGGDPVRTPALVVERLGPAVMPTYAAVLGFRAIRPLFAALELDEASQLHVRQELRVARPLPPAAELRIEAEVAEVWDKGSAALVKAEARLEDGDGELATTAATLFVKGAGGFGGEKGPGRVFAEIPDRPADRTHVEPVGLGTTAVYRLCGDQNPLHIDAEVAASWGFPSPIVHGLWTFGAVARQLIADNGGDFSRPFEVAANLASPLFLGDTLRLSSWSVGEGVVAELGTTRGESVLTDVEARLG